MKKDIVIVVLIILTVLLAGCTDNKGESEKDGTVQDNNSESSGPDADGPVQDATVPREQDEAGAKAEITVFDVGKADAILIRSGDKNILIDTGEEETAQLLGERLKAKGAEQLDMLLITHFDKDHVGGASFILKEFGVDRVFYPDYANTKSAYFAFRRAIDEAGLSGAVSENTEYVSGNMRFAIWPEKDAKALKKESNDYDNDMSLVCMLYFEGYRLLFTGDIEKIRIGEILEENRATLSGFEDSGKPGIQLDCDWIKMPHHGRYQKKIKALLEACTPQYAVITDSVKIPAETDTVVLLQQMKIDTFMTRMGEIVTIVDKDGINVEYAE